VGRSTDENGNRFEIVVTGPEDEAKAFIEKAPVRLEILPAEEAKQEQKYASRGEPEQQYEEAPPHPTAEELARALVVGIRVVEVKSDGPFCVRFEVDPPISPDEPPHIYDFTDYDEADVTCTSTRGDADLHMYEKKCGGGLCEWEHSCSSENTTPEDRCVCMRLHTGQWHVMVTAKEYSEYTLTGDLTVT
jgi:hypothetical protein